MTLPQNSNISSEIDYTSDTTMSDPNIIKSDSIYIEPKKSYRKKKYSSDINKSNSSSEIVKIYINNDNFEHITTNNNTTFYDMERLSGLHFNTIYSILILSTYIIFVDNYKLINNNKNNNCFNRFNCFKNINLFKHKEHLIETQFPGCTFLPFEAVCIIKKNLQKLNNSVFNAELNGTPLFINDTICNGIMFNDGEIIKNSLYKKMEITDMSMFIPIEIYHLKQTEYKLRGFCQIVEELGAKNIEITFKNVDMNENVSKYNMKIEDDIQLIAGSLGLSTSTIDVNKEGYSYNLTYPSNSAIILNEKMIKNKIKQKKYIVSDSIFRSNLELQYLIHSRCRHLMGMYSTVFTFDNNYTIDKNIYMKLKTHGIEISGGIKNYNNIKNNIQIFTKVTFFQLIECTNLINGNNVSLDEIGFTHIINTIKNDVDNFKTNGIFKIISFINMYINHVMKHNQEKHYIDIHKILTKIKKELTIDEYAELLCNYFNINSQWIHFTNFIDLLGKKTQSYDKLGYIVLMNNICIEDRFEKIIKFIQQLCIKNNTEEKFWKMIQPHNIILKYDMEQKFLVEYDFVNNMNWYNMTMLLQCIKCYTVNFSDNMDTKLNELITNMNVGYMYWEYYTNILPFIIQYTKTLYNEIPTESSLSELYISTIFEKNLNIDSFILSKINNMNELKQFIEKKIDRINSAYIIIENTKFPIDINNFLTIFENNTNINKKIQSVLKLKNISYLKRLLNLDKQLLKRQSNIHKRRSTQFDNNIIIDNEDDVINLTISKKMAYGFIYKVFTYNEKLDIKKIPKNYIGFDMILENYNNGIQEEEFKNIVIPFIYNHYKNIEEINMIKQNINMKNFNTFGTSYFETIQYVNKMLEECEL